MRIFWIEMRWDREERRVATRYAAVPASSAKAATRKAQALTERMKMALPEQTTFAMKVRTEERVIDDVDGRALVVSEEEGENPREAALAEVLNLVREVIDDPDKRLVVDEEGKETACLRIEDLERALGTGRYGEDYVVVGDGTAFARERKRAVAELFGLGAA